MSMISTFSRFSDLMAEYRDFGEWRISRVGSREYDDVLKASLSGKSGRVEVWGGDLHRREVWFIGKDKSETLVAVDCYRSNLTKAIEDACKLAGIQRRLFAYA